MGVVYLDNTALITEFPTIDEVVAKALIEPGRETVVVPAASLSRREAELLLLKLDALAAQLACEQIAKVVSMHAEQIVLAVRMLKRETKAEFAGILGAGANLDICWLRPKHVGGPLLNAPAVAGRGLYGGTSGGVLTWLRPFTAGTPIAIIPEQTMAEEATVIHLGAIDLIEVPKLEAIRFQLAGIPTPAQSLPFTFRPSLATETLPLVIFEKPIIVGPERSQEMVAFPNITGDSRLQLLSFLIARAQDLLL